MENKKQAGISSLQKYLTLWAFACMVIGVVIGKFAPAVPAALGKLEISGISIPIDILIWVMIYPMMLKVDFQSVKQVGKNPKGLFVTCIAMVFVWRTLTKGNPAYTVVQVATNDLIILIDFVPIVKFLLGVSHVSVSCSTLFISVLLFVVIPLDGGVLTRIQIVKQKGSQADDVFQAVIASIEEKIV